MRILLTVHQFLPDHTTGTEVLTFQVARELKKSGHEVRIVTGYPMKRVPESNKRFDQYEYQGLQVERYYHQEGAAVGQQSNIVELEYHNHLFADWLRRFLDEWRPDIVHFFHLKNLSATSIDICRDIGIPMVLTPTDFWLVCPTNQLLLPDGSLCDGPDRQGVNCLRHVVTNTQSSIIRRFFEFAPDSWIASAIRISTSSVLAKRPPFSWACALASRTEFIRQRVRGLDCILAPTRFMENLLVTHGMLPKKLECSRFGIDLSGFGPPPIRRGALDALRVGFIGSLLHHKGAHILLDAVRRIPVEIPLVVQVYGNQSVSPEYVKQLVELVGDDPRIHFCGTFPNEAIGEVFANIDVFVVPSLWYENTPLVMYSAQAACCPIVSSNLGGMSEVIRDGIDGLLFPSGDSEALASILEKLCLNREMVNTLAENSPRVKSITEYTSELESTYREILTTRETMPS